MRLWTWTSKSALLCVGGRPKVHVDRPKRHECEAHSSPSRSQSLARPETRRFVSSIAMRHAYANVNGARITPGPGRFTDRLDYIIYVQRRDEEERGLAGVNEDTGG